MNKILKVLISTILLLFIVSCGGLTDDEVTYQNGTLVLTLGSKESRTVTPDTDMIITTYLIEGSGPNTNTFSVEQGSLDPVFVISYLREGDWSITVSAKNTAGVVVGEGSADVTISQLSTTSADISVEPIVGIGTLNVTIIIPDEEVVSSSITSYLVPQAEVEQYLSPEGITTEIPILFDPYKVLTDEDGNIILPFESHDSDIDNGYYLMVITLEDEGKPIWIKNEMVRIIANEVTTMDYELTEQDLNQLEGNLSLDISENMLAPLEVSLEFDFTPTIDDGEDYGITATIAAIGNAASYLWILDGETQTNTNSNLFLTHLIVDRIYQLTVIVTDGSQIGSATKIFFGDEYLNLLYPTI